MTSKDSGIFQKKEDVPPKFRSKIRELVKKIIGGDLSYRGAAAVCKVSRYQIEQWVKIFKQEVLTIEDVMFDSADQLKIAKKINEGGLTIRQAAIDYNIPAGLVKSWVKKLPQLEKENGPIRVKDINAITPVERCKIAHMVRDGKLSLSKASKEYQITRYTVQNWVKDYAMVNLDESTNTIKFNSMSSTGREKELLEQIEKLKQQAKDDKLKIITLETLIEVAEEKFDFQIKKKPGSTQQQK